MLCIPTNIAIDWGSSNFRAYLLDAQQSVLDTITLNKGIKQQHGGDYAKILKKCLQPWEEQILQYKLPILMIGMIGSNLGWHEVPYVACPFPLPDLVRDLFKLTSPWQTTAYIVPGAKVETEQSADVMRGEETLILGAHQLFQASVYCLPGTHSKWAYIENNKLTTFSTLMTGELYAVLLEHSLLGLDLPEQQFDEMWFTNGVHEAADTDDVLAHLFHVRAKRILKQLPSSAAASYLSGLLIGNEISTMVNKTDIADSFVAMVATSEGLAKRYQTAFNLLSTPIKLINGEDAFIKGVKTFIQELQ